MSSILDLKPEKLWFYFNEICNIPHPSGKEGKISQYLVNFGKKLNLETSSDEVGNVLIRKPAFKGYENAPAVILQSHMDMVCEKNEGTVHDFEKDPIKTYIDGDWVKAEGTTLGADNGIGVAAMLAILADNTLKHPALDCLFTVDEERGLTGAQHVCADWLKAPLLLNLDSEDDGKFCIGCAGGIDTIATFNLKREARPENSLSFNITAKGLKGGHSGEDINKERGNAIKIISRFLWSQNKLYPITLQSLQGGNLHNAIPREASFNFVIPFNQKEELRKNLNLFITTLNEEFPNEPELSISLESHSNDQSDVISKKQSDQLLYALFACPHGVISMSKEIENLPETSTNLASVKMPDDLTLIVSTSQRSSVESKKHEIKDRVEAIFALAGADKITHSDGYPGWKPNLQSKIKKIVVEAFYKLFKEEATVSAIHAGLECGLFYEKNPKLDMISIGPDIFDNHSPSEKCKISSVERFWLHTIEILENIH